MSPQCNQSPPCHQTQGLWITTSTDPQFDSTFSLLHIHFSGRYRNNTLCIFTILLKKEDNHQLHAPSRGGTVTAQPHGPTSPAPYTDPLIHLEHTLTHTHGWPHQDTVLHMNSGLNSILLSLRQQINRSARVTGNHILGQRMGLEQKRLRGQSTKRKYHTRL